MFLLQIPGLKAEYAKLMPQIQSAKFQYINNLAFVGFFEMNEIYEQNTGTIPIFAYNLPLQCILYMSLKYGSDNTHSNV